MVNIAVLVSGGGTNLQALIDAQRSGRLKHGRLALVISSRPGVQALKRAEEAGIPGLVCDRGTLGPQGMEAAMRQALGEHRIGLIVLAGFLSILSPGFVAAYPGRIVNVHPSLIPAFSGPGCYGLRVHEAALARGVRVTGATVHLVNEAADGGEILLQKAVRVQKGDTPQSLQRRVMAQAEWQLLPRAVSMLSRRLSKEESDVPEQAV